MYIHSVYKESPRHYLSIEIKDHKFWKFKTHLYNHHSSKPGHITAFANHKNLKILKILCYMISLLNTVSSYVCMHIHIGVKAAESIRVCICMCIFIHVCACYKVHIKDIFIISYYRFLWKRTSGLNLIQLMKGLPLSLQTEISFHVYKNIIRKVSV